MNKATFVLMFLTLIAAAMIVSATVANSDVIATHKNGHSEPPACDNNNGKAPDKNKHCQEDDQNEEDPGDGDEDSGEDSPGEDDGDSEEEDNNEG